MAIEKNAMKEIPILMSAPMVLAIIAGRKTKTRRIVKPQPELDEDSGRVFSGHSPAKRSPFDIHNWKDPYVECFSRWKVGDILWVRESFVYRSKHDKYYFKADHAEPNTEPYAHSGWKPSIHMPKEAARIWLEVTEVKVERLQEISNEDAIAEGVNHGDQSPKSIGGAIATMVLDARSEFFSLWTKINGEDSLDSNPWVWCITFKVLSTTGRPHFLNV